MSQVPASPARSWYLFFGLLGTLLSGLSLSATLFAPPPAAHAAPPTGPTQAPAFTTPCALALWQASDLYAAPLAGHAAPERGASTGILGKVLWNGAPAATVELALYGLSYASNCGPYLNKRLLATTTTNDRGEYEFATVPPLQGEETHYLVQYGPNTTDPTRLRLFYSPLIPKTFAAPLTLPDFDILDV
ncbi:MAG: hypothetical protein KIT87_29640, partial [Anaerolineae bacterium]|nr:hypothetical protein [Anaerolineae bacterium]